jgi:hypothetical protein
MSYMDAKLANLIDHVPYISGAEPNGASPMHRNTAPNFFLLVRNVERGHVH